VGEKYPLNLISIMRAQGSVQTASPTRHRLYMEY
jgi:hypothetical protein